jgi:inner membrane transporter RhtA
MSRLPRASFALMLALLPATAAIIAALVLAQIPTGRDILGIALVMLGVAAHKPAPSVTGSASPPALHPGPREQIELP